MNAEALLRAYLTVRDELNAVKACESTEMRGFLLNALEGALELLAKDIRVVILLSESAPSVEYKGCKWSFWLPGMRQIVVMDESDPAFFSATH